VLAKVTGGVGQIRRRTLRGVIVAAMRTITGNAPFKRLQGDNKDLTSRVGKLWRDNVEEITRGTDRSFAQMHAH
jgi:hypothetical protein